jgi:polysaccharide deacetylase 2 family uncharacterized protein YibQ
MKTVIIAVIVCAIIGTGIGIFRHTLSSPLPFLSHITAGLLKNNSGTHDTLVSKLYAQLRELEVQATDIKQSADDSTNTTITINARVPKGMPLESIVGQLTLCNKKTSYTVADCIYDESRQRCTLTYCDTLKKRPDVLLIIALGNRFYSASTQLAIIGEVTDTTDKTAIASFTSIDEPLSCALIPSFPHTPEYAQIARQNNKELIIKLPFEPSTLISSKFPGPVIMLDDTRATIHSIITEATRAVPGYAGFTHLWGNRILGDSRVMNIVLEEIHKKNGYFIENPITRQSVVAPMAHDMQLAYGTITGTIPPGASAPVIEEQLKQYTTGNQRSSLVITATITPQLSASIKAMLPWFKQNGIKLVYASTIMEPNKQAD